jgi:predicted protein tyrosine phosphatase
MADYEMNRLANAGNPYQGSFKRVLCVCSAGLLRSPTAAVVLSQEPYNYNTRAAGLVPQFALIPVDKVLIHWAEEIVCMTDEQAESLRPIVPEDKKIVVLGIPDNFAYRDPELVELIKKSYDQHLLQGAK